MSIENQFVYIPVKENSKIAAIPWKFINTSVQEKILRKHPNKAILTGKTSHIVVLDIDPDGIENWKEYCKKNGTPKTVCAKTPREGFHYYFNYTPVLSQNRVNVNGLGWDIRSDGGYVLCEPSMINTKKYKWMSSPESTKISNIPEELLKMLACEKPKKTVVRKDDNHEVVRNNADEVYSIDDFELEALLNLLESKYYDNRSEWLLITSSLKSLGKKSLWTKFSKKSDKYDKHKNEIVWDTINPIININYIIDCVNKQIKYKKDKIAYLYPTIDYVPISNKFIKCNKRVVSEKDLINKKFLDIKSYIGDHKTLIIKSDTGTGKTTSTAEYIKSIDNGDRIISVVSRRALVRQQMKTFKSKGIKLVNYQSGFEEIDNVSIQVDSILKQLKDDTFENCIIYLDEVNSLISYMIESSTLDNRRIGVFGQLSRMIKECKILICTDADISDLVFKYLSNLRDMGTTQYIENPFKNYNKIIATRYKDESLIIEEMKERIKNKEYFLCAFDSKSRMEEVYEAVIVEDQKDRFKTYSSTAGNEDDFENVSETWKDCYIFYTPKVIYGLDFQPEISTDVFLICNGNTINPLQIAQQMTRCRNIKNVHFFFARMNKELTFKTTADVAEYYKVFEDQFESLLNQYGGIRLSDDDIKSRDVNKFTEMFYMSRMFNSILNSNYLYHFMKIISDKGMTIKTVGEYNIVDRKELKEKAKVTKAIKIDEIIDEKVDAGQLYETIKTRTDMCKITIDDLKDHPEWRDIITNDNTFRDHQALCKLIEVGGVTDERFKIKTKTDYKEHNLTSLIAKIEFCRKLEEVLNVGVLDINYDKYCDRYDEKLKTNDNLLQLYKKQFTKSETNKPIVTFQDGYNMLIKCYKNICGEQLISSTRKQKKVDKKNVSIMQHTISKECLDNHISLYQKINPALECINNNFIKNNEYQPILPKKLFK